MPPDSAFTGYYSYMYELDSLMNRDACVCVCVGGGGGGGGGGGSKI